MYLNIPDRIRSISRVFVANLALFTLLRYAFLVQFKTDTFELFSENSLTAFYLGLKFDCRLSVFLILPMLLLSWIPFLDMTKSRRAYLRWNLFQTTLMLPVLTLYFADFGNYSYLKTRINATVLALLDTPGISGQMVWQSYPVIKLACLMLLLLSVYCFLIHRPVDKKTGLRFPRRSSAFKAFPAYFFLTILIFLMGYGKIARFPLRWSDAFFSTDAFTSQFTLNPVLALLESLREEPANYNLSQVKKYYPVLADYYKIDSTETPEPLLHREKNPDEKKEITPNVVIILLETFAAFKTGTFGNKLNPSPNFDSLAGQGILFTRCFTPMENTSRSIFALLFGIPDVSQKRSSSRNPLVVKQHTIINSFTDYTKLYFLGGSASWGNIRGMLSHNLDNLTLYEEGDYSSPVHDVWGISDADLFEEANQVLTREKKPFFAVIQTAGNHRPYKIPENTEGFNVVVLPDADIKKNGFISAAEFNHFRLLDHSLGHFFRLAEKERYYKNTVFVILGDHGTTGGAKNPLYGSLSLEVFHVPLLFYAPEIIKTSQKRDIVASELDILPSIAGFLGIKYRNQTFGQDLFDPGLPENRLVFTFSTFERPPRLGLLSDTYYLNVSPEGESVLYMPWSKEPQKNVSTSFPEVSERMTSHATGVYELAKYLLYNNK